MYDLSGNVGYHLRSLIWKKIIKIIVVTVSQVLKEIVL